MQLARILREAVSNVIKHSAASRRKVRWNVEVPRRMAFATTAAPSPIHFAAGQGMSGMKMAKWMNGPCLVESRPGNGLEVLRTIPLE